GPANELLAAPTDVGLALTQQLGFHVVGRLGARHGIEVALAPTPGGGLTAVVRIPSSLFPSDDDGIDGDDRGAGLQEAAVAPAVPPSLRPSRTPLRSTPQLSGGGHRVSALAWPPPRASPR